MQSPGKHLRTLINAPEILVLPGVFDGFSTRLVEQAGYTAAFITGSGISESRLGQPDLGIMGLEENVAGARAAGLRAFQATSPADVVKWLGEGLR